MSAPSLAEEIHLTGMSCERELQWHWYASVREANGIAYHLMETNMDTPVCEMLEDISLAAAGLTSVTTDMLPRRRAHAVLERLRLETVLADLSAAFVRAPAEALHDHIQAGLQRLVKCVAIDRSALVEVSADQATLHPLYSYALPEVPSHGSNAMDQQPWYTATLRRGEIVRFSRPDELPAEARAELASYLGAGCHSSLTMPLMMDGEVRYAITFSSFHSERTWPDELIPRLRLAGEIFANAVSRKRSTEATQRLQQELVHMTRVVMLGELAATLAHELSRPLAAILSNAQAAYRFLAMASPQLQEVQEALDDVLVDTRRAAKLLQRLRALAKKTDLQRTPFDTNEMIREVIHLVGGEASARGVAIKLQPQDDLPYMCGDRVQLQQVLLNLVLNAFEAIAEAGDGPREVLVRTRREPSEVITVSVEDSGIGLEDDALQHIFDPFFSTKTDGMGMGLAISRSIIMTHHGRIWATSYPGRGVTVSFSIPTDCKETV
jgi:signal transduction histidine kinase